MRKPFAMLIILAGLVLLNLGSPNQRIPAISASTIRHSLNEGRTPTANVEESEAADIGARRGRENPLTAWRFASARTPYCNTVTRAPQQPRARAAAKHRRAMSPILT